MVLAVHYSRAASSLPCLIACLASSSAATAAPLMMCGLIPLRPVPFRAFAAHDFDAVVAGLAKRSAQRARSSRPVCIDPMITRLRSVAKPGSNGENGFG